MKALSSGWSDVFCVTLFFCRKRGCRNGIYVREVKNLTNTGIISRVISGSIADEMGLTAGDKIVSVNGKTIRDIIDLSFALAEEYVELIIEKANGEQELLEIEKDFDEDIGIEFESAVFDNVRQCANRCIFCFVDQMPKGMRESLYIKDDDYRLSFLYGNFITLTNLMSRDFERINRLHLSPLYVSVHTTDGKLRAEMLGNKQASNIMSQLSRLFDSGVEIHTQIVLCPGINDGYVLEKTIRDLYAATPNVLSLAIVPVGLTRYREGCYPLSVFNQEKAREVIVMVHRWQERCRQEIGSSFVYLSDEFYLSAGMEIPEANFYDGFPQLENGVGIVRNFLTEWEEVLAMKSDGYEMPLYLDVVCGVSAHKILEPLLRQLVIPNLIVRVIAVENVFFGSSVTVTGLLTGRDILDALQKQQGCRSGVIIPGIALRKGESVFLDGITPADLERELGTPVRIAYFAQDLYTLLSAWR
ncbi:MAG: DUF512 domain-containing protein [Negativicutes bacterium]|nr:DUF512 domain-containing protein [Negativicutes bacterium]